MLIRSSSCWRVVVFLVSFAVSSSSFVTTRSAPFARNVPRGSRIWSSPPEKEDETNLDADGLRALYPALEANQNGTIAVDDMHTLFYQEYGQNSSSKDALTALFLHGGPGSGCNPNHARFFDPDKYRIILLDQRGSGQSTPRGAVERNTLQYLIQDCESLRTELGIQRWDVILGGSWGTTLALAYAQTYPESVGALVLRGVCLLRPPEINWLFSSMGGVASLDPDGWKNFSDAVRVFYDNDDKGRAALYAHYNRLLGSDPVERMNAARSWMIWEMRASSLAKRSETETENSTQPPVVVWDNEAGWSCQDSEGKWMHNSSWYVGNELRKGLVREYGPPEEVTAPRRVASVVHLSPDPVGVFDRKKESPVPQEVSNFIPAQAMLTCFYSANERYAIDNVDLLAEERIDRLRSIPCIAVQGGNDFICPPDTALDLHAVWPEMELRIPSDAGHSMYDPAVTNELIQATDRFANPLEKQEESESASDQHWPWWFAFQDE